ncbi:MAG: L,D-transpeptidase [Acidobacteria bacterium]|nr:L,D-transpeptidase [Acidobacteriota bacterium]
MGRLARSVVAVVGLTGGLMVPGALSANAQSPLVVRATSQVSARVTTTMPLLRLHFTSPLSATRLPSLTLTPSLATKWQQIGPRDVQAVAVAAPAPTLSYAITLPTSLRCTATCTVTSSHVVQTAVAVNILWEEQLLAQLNYLPVAFSPLAKQTTPSEQVPGFFTWRFAGLPASLAAQWSPGSDNVILRGALMNFQNVHNLPASGEIDAGTWNALIGATLAHQVDPASYNYVDVTEGSPEVVTLYLNGVNSFHTLANTGIPQAPTAAGTYPVYLRYTSQTMSGTNPNGTHYSDPGIPWVSYFNGGDALHGFIRAGYGFPQSLGCVEMPFASAALVWPHTPIGTLVTVRP